MNILLLPGYLMEFESEQIINEIMKTLSSNSDDIVDKFNSLYQLSKDQQKEIENLQTQITNI